jgi:hypothetical protein
VFKFLIIFSSIVVSALALASTDNQNAENQSSAQVPVEIKSTSTMNRADKNFTFTGEVLGIGPSGVYGQGLNFGYFINSSTILSLEFNGGKNSTSHGYLFTWGDSLSQEGYSAGIHLKKFVSNSLYLKGGADHRSFKYKYINDFWFSNDESQREFTGESTAVAFAIGNQWQMANFTLGCDWFGLELPVMSKVRNERFSANSTDYDRRDNERDIERYITGLGYTALRFYLGASF